MALCERSLYPVAKLSKHLYDDQGPQRDRVGSRAVVSASGGLRSRRQGNAELVSQLSGGGFCDVLSM